MMNNLMADCGWRMADGGFFIFHSAFRLPPSKEVSDEHQSLEKIRVLAAVYSARADDEL